MKKASLIIGAIAFSTLFYGKSIGLNLFLFSLLTVIILFVSHRSAFKNKTTLGYSVVYLATAAAVFFHDALLSILANISAFFTLIGYLSQQKTSIYVHWLNGIYTTTAGWFHRNFSVNELSQKVEPKTQIDYAHWAKLIIVPAIILIIFIGLYQNGNPLFSDLIDQIDFSFINIQWLLFAVLGYYLFLNIHKPVTVETITKTDLNTGNSLSKSKAFSIPKLKQEHQLGSVLIALLNVLIVIFLITDFTFIFTNLDLRASVFSEQVHNGINALIASIVIAIIILLYVFRGDLNFYEGNKTVKWLAFTWLMLNAILVLSISIKNSQYIFYFGLTYKRIGVMVYLTLALIGLFSTLIKINNIKNIWYLVRLNTKAAFVVLVLAAMVNWDYHITYFNFNYAKSMDVKYLIELSNNNTMYLKSQTGNKHLEQISVSHIEHKYNNYIDELNSNSWQELQYDNLKINPK